MKKIVFILSIFAVISTSCEKELNKSPLTEFADETFWTSEQNVKQALTGVYRGNIQMALSPEYGPTDWWSYHGLIFLEFATDNAYDRRGDNSAINRLTNGTLVNNNGILLNYWSASYNRIARCNYFLENVGKASLNAATLKRYIAEVRFIRACQYFYLSQHYGSVPLITEVLTLDEANNVIKAPIQEVKNYAETEFIAAAADLPRYSELTVAEKGRASAQVALAFLGRLYLAEKKWTEAAAVYKKIIDYNDNIIDPDYIGLFNGDNEGSKEIIFATQFIQDLASNAIQQHTYPAIFGGYMLFCPLGSIVESYEFNDGTPFSYTDSRYDAADLGANRDPRLKFNVIYNGQPFKNIIYDSHPNSTTSPDQLTTFKQATRTGYAPKKFNSEVFSGGDLQNSGIDIPVIRYAEVLLGYLEAKMESGSVDQDLLDETINKVRGRASVNMPRVTETDFTKLQVILRRERRNELAFEGIRLWDILRWGIAGEVLNKDFYGAPFPNATNLRKKGNMVDPYSRWYVTSKAFRVGTDELWPVPLAEININPKLQ